ncbi:MAG: TIR domain-containing protein [Chloroflexota bacterium]
MADRFNMSDVMISYSRRDKPFVQALEKAIAKTGRATWVDWDDIPPTVNWWNENKAKSSN